MRSPILKSFTAAAATAILATACGSDSTGPGGDPGPAPGPSEAGTYVLDNIENHPVPYNYDSKDVSGGTVRAYWLSGELVLKADHGFTLKMTSKVTGPGYLGLPTTQTWNGTWAAETDGVKLTHSSGVAHYFFTGNKTELNTVASYTRMAGGAATLGLTFKR